MSNTKRFHVGTILSIIDGKLVSPDHISGIYAICDWMTAESNMTHQLPRVSREIEPHLRKQFPDLAEIEVPAGLNSEADVIGFLASLEAEHGTHRDVAPLAADDHTHIDPVAEIKMINPTAKIIEF